MVRSDLRTLAPVVEDNDAPNKLSLSQPLVHSSPTSSGVLHVLPVTPLTRPAQRTAEMFPIRGEHACWCGSYQSAHAGRTEAGFSPLLGGVASSAAPASRHRLTAPPRSAPQAITRATAARRILTISSSSLDSSCEHGGLLALAAIVSSAQYNPAASLLVLADAFFSDLRSAKTAGSSDRVGMRGVDAQHLCPRWKAVGETQLAALGQIKGRLRTIGSGNPLVCRWNPARGP